MTNAFQPTEQQHEGQEHAFLDYQQVDVYFVYSFTWDSNNLSWKRLCDDLKKEKNWILPRLHDRAIDAIYDGHLSLLANTYQPSLVSKKRVLEKNITIQERATLLLPISGKIPNREIIFRFSYTIRIFENGGGVCTFQARLQKEPKDDGAAMFEKIHAVMHLARNVDYVSAEHSQTCNARDTPSHLTDAYILVPPGTKKPVSSDEDWSLYPRNYTQCTLHDLYKSFLETASWRADPGSSSPIPRDGRNPLDKGDPNQDFQSPFVVTVAEVERNSFLRFRKHPTIDSLKEVGSIMCKLTMDNRAILKDYLHLSEDYITTVLDYNDCRGGLINYCPDRRLFFAFSKRGAIAITANLRDLPSCFVVPSFLNLLEIVRARWHMCCVLNMQLDEFIDKLGDIPEKDAPQSVELIFDQEDIETLVELRRSYMRFLQDPIPYLFDGGSVTEISKRAVIELDMEELSQAIHRKMQMLDAMRQDLEDRERQRRREQFEQELRRVQASTGE